MRIQLNGKPHTLSGETGLLKLLEDMKVNPEIVAVEVNEEIVKRADRQAVLLKEGDRVEVIRMIGGG
jgi:sulfur carrier protein